MTSLLIYRWGILTPNFPRSLWSLNEIRSSQKAWYSQLLKKWKFLPAPPPPCLFLPSLLSLIITNSFYPLFFSGTVCFGLCKSSSVLTHHAGALLFQWLTYWWNEALAPLGWGARGRGRLVCLYFCGLCPRNSSGQVQIWSSAAHSFWHESHSQGSDWECGLSRWEEIGNYKPFHAYLFYDPHGLGFTQIRQHVD